MSFECTHESVHNTRNVDCTRTPSVGPETYTRKLIMKLNTSVAQATSDQIRPLCCV